MKGLLIALLVVASAASMGCSKKKKPSQQAMINACLFDPTGNCPRQAAALAMAGGAGMPPGLAINQGGNNPFILPPTTGGGAVRVASHVSDKDVRAQAFKVQSAIKADSLNPNSIHYDPPVSNVPQQSAADIAAARSALTQNDQVGLNRVPAGGGAADGEEEGVR